jgi:hypothetical protein
MTPRPVRRGWRHPALWLIPGLFLVVGPAPVVAQLQTTDPYDPSGAMYRPFVYPGYANDPARGYRPVYQGGPAGANQMQSYYSTLDSGGNRAGAGVLRYDRAYRLEDEVAGRQYLPNEKVDAEFYADRQKRDELFFLAEREKDPNRRARLMREYRALDARLTRELSDSRRDASKAGTSTTRAPSTSTDSERREARNRSTAPPIPGLGSRGSSSRRPSNRLATDAATGLPILPKLPSLSDSSTRSSNAEASPTSRAPAAPSEVLRRVQAQSRGTSAPPIPGPGPGSQTRQPPR